MTNVPEFAFAGAEVAAFELLLPVVVHPEKMARLSATTIRLALR